MKSSPENKTDSYIEAQPKEVQRKLKEIRAWIREVAPDAQERTDYFQFPGYSYEGYDYDGMFVWFSYKKPFLRLHVRPPVIKDHEKELSKYKRTLGMLSFPEQEEIPAALVKKLTKESLKVMKDKAKKK